MEAWNGILGGFLVPVLLFTLGGYFTARLRRFWILHPIRTLRTLGEGAARGGTSPLAALSMALAGTLGVGNIAGVATAITAGGAGAVLWMLIGAFAAMSIKYAEVSLAVRYRHSRTESGRRTFFGGAMFTIRDGLGARARTESGRRAAAVLGGIFALLCVIHSLLTGSIVQVHAAVQCVDFPPLAFGILFAVPAILAAWGGTDRTARFTAWLIPALSALFILLSMTILFARAGEIPAVLGRI